MGSSRERESEPAGLDRPAGSTPPIDLDDWETDEDLRAAKRLIGRIGREAGPLEIEGSDHRVDEYHDTVRDWHAQLRNHPQRTERGSRVATRGTSTKRPGSFLAWTSISLGLMALVCGGVLLGWGYLFGRGELWSLGLPVALTGQAVLLVGVVFQMDGLWQNNRETSRSLEELDENLSDLKHTTTMLGTTHSSAAHSFYAHMAEGASPELMLADVKGQLDMLTLRLARQRG